jgi:hypothetical protein
MVPSSVATASVSPDRHAGAVSDQEAEHAGAVSDPYLNKKGRPCRPFNAWAQCFSKLKIDFSFGSDYEITSDPTPRRGPGWRGRGESLFFRGKAHTGSRPRVLNPVRNSDLKHRPNPPPARARAQSCEIGTKSVPFNFSGSFLTALIHGSNEALLIGFRRNSGETPRNPSANVARRRPSSTVRKKAG